MTGQKSAVIGHTGFVGSTLVRSGWPHDAVFNSTSIQHISGRHFELIVCAGVSAVKWTANKEPEADWQGISRLIEALSTVTADRFVLISTTDIYPIPIAVTEADLPNPEDGQPYGRHRLRLEQWVAAHFPVHHVVRLPALFGTGLKKNAIFDMLTGNMVDRVNPNGIFQWYPMRRLASDLRTIIEAGTPLINVAPEPVSTATIAGRLFPGVTIGSPDMPSLAYDMRTRHAEILGGRGRYHIDGESVLSELATYVQGVRAKGGVP